MRVNHFLGVTNAQKELVSVWASLARRNDGLPRKRDLDPGVLRRHLSRISVLDLEVGGVPRFRLSGSRLSAMIGVDPTGLCPSDLPAPHGDIFMLGLEQIMSRKSPVGGLVSVEANGTGQTWLRLPLADDAGELRYVLCHDDILTEQEEGEEPPVPGAIHVETLSRAA